MSRWPQVLAVGDDVVRVACKAIGNGRWVVQVGDARHELNAGPLGDGGFWFETSTGRRHHAFAAILDNGIQVRVDGRTWLLRSAERVGEDVEDTADPTQVRAPMTGTIVKVLVTAGDSIAKDQDLVVLSAMKMEHRLAALQPGRVVEIATAAGATVDAGTLLLRLEIDPA